MPVKYWPENSGIKGIGISDWIGFNKYFGTKIDYINGQYHEEPRIDIRNPPDHLLGTADFVSCSDVFEHVDPPISIAFEGLYSLLKPGGTLIFSVPYTFADTVEHFPDLFEWSIQQHDDRYTLINKTRDGTEQVFNDLVFHGGPGQVLEMRVFGFTDIVNHLERAGFSETSVFDDQALDFGIRSVHPWSLPICAKRNNS